MAAKSYLAFDLGAESGRAVLGTLDNGKLSLEVKHRFANPNGRIGGHLYWNLLSQWEELKAGLRNVAGVKLDGIGVDTWGVDYALIAEDGTVLGNPFHYRDTRTDGVMEKAFAKVPREKIFDATGIQFMQINSLYQLMATSPIFLSAGKTLLFVPDLFNYLFTGIAKNEFSIASTSQMYDPREKAVGDRNAGEARHPDAFSRGNRAVGNGDRAIAQGSRCRVRDPGDATGDCARVS